MRGKTFWFCAVVLFGGVLIASSALAWVSDPVCIGEAKEDYKLCVKVCQDEFRNDKDTCHKIDLECADECREDYEECVDVPLTTLADCKADCNSLFEQTRDYCRETYKFGTWERDKCIDWAQHVAFGCRDQCRENVHVALTDCRVKFRTCIKACPPLEEPQ